MTLKITAFQSSVRRFPVSCLLALSLSANAFSAEKSQAIDDLFDSAESLIPPPKATQAPVESNTAANADPKDSESLIPTIPQKSAAEQLTDANEVVPPPPTTVSSEEDLIQEPSKEEKPEAETNIEAPKLDPAIELMRLREENTVLKDQLRRVDSSVAERDIKIGELQEEIAKISDERNAISTQFQKTKSELSDEIQMLKTKSSVLEQSILQHEISQQEAMSQKSSRAARYKGVVNRYLEPGIEFITPVYE